MANVPLLKAKKKLQSIQSFMIMPSWESGFWAIRLPLTLIERKSFTTGFALRAGPLTLGTDHIGSWVTTATLTGSDIYVALQLPIFYDNNRQRKGSAGKNSNLFRCYTF
jgi:hypothetical protein